MKFAILYSKKDQAGINIAQQLKDYFLPQTPIIELKKESIYSEDIDKDPRIKEAEFIIFATKHQSSAKIPSLSLHAPGNFRDAKFGGKQGKVCPTSSQALKFLFQRLTKNSESMNVTLECTHHGPLINKPCCFIEIGSDEKAWQDKKLGKIIAKTIADFQNFKPDRKIKTTIGIGGPHYCPNFNKIQLSEKSNIAISHIISEYSLPLTQSMIEQSVEKTLEHIDLILLDWKGLGNSEKRQQIIGLLDKLGLKYQRTEHIDK